MIPRQLEEVARQRTQPRQPQVLPVRTVSHERGRPGTIRRHTGWGLVAIGLRIAESGGR